MTDQKPEEPTPKPMSPLADDEPDPSVKPPPLAWMYKSYKSEKPDRDGTAKPRDDVK
jgi:hypothetical protein